MKKILSVLLCVLFAVTSLCQPWGVSAPTVNAARLVYYSIPPEQAVVDGVTYVYRDDYDKYNMVQITAIFVPEGKTRLELPDKIEGRVVRTLNLRSEDGAVKLPGITYVKLPGQMIFRGIDHNPSCVPGNPEINGNYLLPSLTSYFENLEEIDVDKENPDMTASQGVLFDKSLTILYYYPRCKRDAEYKEPDSVINSYGYEGCLYLKKLTFSSNKIYSTIWSCAGSGLETVVIKDNITYINDGAFENCKNLKNVKLPAGLTGIGSGAFRGCTSLRKINLPDSLQHIYAYTFWGTSIKKIKLPASLQSLGKHAFSKSTKVARPGYFKSARAKYVDKAYYSNDNYEYIAMATAINPKTKKKKCYPADDVDAIWPVKNKVRLKKGKTISLKTTAEIINGYDKNGKEKLIKRQLTSEILSYRSSKPGTVQVKKNGKVKGKKKGKAVIWVSMRTNTDRGKKGYKVTVSVR